MLTSSVAYRQVTADMGRSLTRIGDMPHAARETEYYRENIEKIRSIDDFMADERIYAYALTAFGLGEMRYAKAFIRKVLEGGIDQPDSVANRLADRRIAILRPLSISPAMARSRPRSDARARRRFSVISTRRWKLMPVAGMRVCASRSISRGKPRGSRARWIFSPIRLC